MSAAPGGARCVRERRGTPGRWSVATGRKEAYWQGWYSPEFRKLVPAPVLCYSTAEPDTIARFRTRIELVPPAAADAPP